MRRKSNESTKKEKTKGPDPMYILIRAWSLGEGRRDGVLVSLPLFESKRRSAIRKSLEEEKRVKKDRGGPGPRL